MHCLLALPLLALAPLGDPQTKWIELLPGSAVGAPPVVELVDALSGPDRTVIDVRIPGFWAETGVAADGAPYVRYSLPETPSRGCSRRRPPRPGRPNSRRST